MPDTFKPVLTDAQILAIGTFGQSPLRRLDHGRAVERAAILADRQARTCAWGDDGEGNWSTACNGIFTIIDGTPRENEMTFCPYCGGQLTTMEDSGHVDS